MPVPTVVCAICGKEASKRSTLSLAILGAGDGRACRSHGEVAAIVKGMSEQAMLSRSTHDVERRMKVISCVAGVRAICTLYGLSLEFVIMRLRKYYPKDPGMLRDIEEGVMRCGGPIISDQEMGESVMNAIWLSQKHAELGL